MVNQTFKQGWKIHFLIGNLDLTPVSKDDVKTLKVLNGNCAFSLDEASDLIDWLQMIDHSVYKSPSWEKAVARIQEFIHSKTPA